MIETLSNILEILLMITAIVALIFLITLAGALIYAFLDDYVIKPYRNRRHRQRM